MACSEEFVKLICEQIENCGAVHSKKMFGEYMVYLNGKPIFLLCDDTVFVKILPQTTEILGEESEQGYPYNGAKLHYAIDRVEDRELMSRLALALDTITLLPKKKKQKERA